MKKITITLIVLTTAIRFASAQLLPTFQFGLKGGVDFASLSSGHTFSSSNQTGYLGGVWARFGALGFNFQPEMYVTSKDVNVTSNANGIQAQAKFTSLDVPLLIGGKVGALGFGARFYTGPVFSFAIDKSQSFSQAAGNAVSLNYHDQNYAWQFGVGVDIQRISVDLRYEAGLNNQNYGLENTKVSLFNLSLAYRLFKL